MPRPSSPSASLSSDVADEILDAINKFTVSSPASLFVPPLDLSGKLSATEGGNLEELDKQKRVKLLCMTPELIHDTCCGHIGESSNIFCVKTKASCSSYQKGGKHKQRSFKPSPMTYYITRTTAGESAWTDHCIADEDIANKTLFKKDLMTSKTIVEWKALFEVYKVLSSDATEDVLDQTVKFMTLPPSMKNLKTPGKLRNLKAIKEEFRLSEDDESSELVDLLQLSDEDLTSLKSAAVPEIVIQIILRMVQVLQRAIFMVREARGELMHRAMIEDVSQDFTGLTLTVAGLKNTLGTNSRSDHPDVWSAIELLEALVNDKGKEIKELLLEKFPLVENQLKDLTSLTDSFGNRWQALFKNWIPTVSSHGSMLNDLTNDLSAVRVQLKRNQDDDLLNATSLPSVHSVRTGSTEALRDRIQNLNESVNEITAKLRIMETSVESAQMDIVDLKDFESRASRNNSETPSSASKHSTSADGFGTTGTSYKQYYFKDEDALLVWMKEHMSLPSHGLFVDIVSFSEFFGGDRYVERNTTLNDLYMSNKIGYATMADSIVAASFQNVLPGAYGRNSATASTTASSDLQAQPELPGLGTFKKWDNQDGSTGRKYWIKKEARSTQHQIDGMIRQQLSGEAQYLAKDLLMDSASMSDAMFNFISTSYEDTMHSGRFESNQAWALTSKFVKRIFAEIGDARVIARDGVHVNDPWTTAAKFVFATLKAHEVMRAFMRLDIKDHPSISSEMVKFICYSQPSHDTADILMRLSAAETLMRTNQGSIAKLDSRLKKLEAHRTESDKLLKKLKEHANL